MHVNLTMHGIQSYIIYMTSSCGLIYSGHKTIWTLLDMFKNVAALVTSANKFCFYKLYLYCICG